MSAGPWKSHGSAAAEATAAGFGRVNFMTCQRLMNIDNPWLRAHVIVAGRRQQARQSHTAAAVRSKLRGGALDVYSVWSESRATKQHVTRKGGKTMAFSTAVFPYGFCVSLVCTGKQLSPEPVNTLYVRYVITRSRTSSSLRQCARTRVANIVFFQSFPPRPYLLIFPWIFETIHGFQPAYKM